MTCQLQIIFWRYKGCHGVYKVVFGNSYYVRCAILTSLLVRLIVITIAIGLHYLAISPVLLLLRTFSAE